MTELFQLLVSGFALGAIYGLVALGFVVIYRASQVFNFAHGELLTLGAVLMVWLNSPPAVIEDALALGGSTVDGLGWPWALSLMVALGVTGLVAAVIEGLCLRPLVGRPVFVPIIVTLFVGAILRMVVMLIFGNDSMPILTPWESMGAFDLGGAMIDYSSSAAIVAGGFAFLVFGILVRYTRLGVAMRATSSNQETALGLGIPVGKVLGVTWFLAGTMAALAGIFLGIRDYSVDMNLGFIAMRAFPAVIVGGLDSALGAVVAGLLLGTLEVLTAGYVNSMLGPFGKNFHTVLPYLVMILFLMVRPYGLFGTKKVERV
ncbi:MAG: branched-chain amino acid ABC transporter permease [Myxococcota bacterium]|nr:branched-chain amino acid ABC transporter permease [Myxococcota bacterium]